MKSNLILCLALVVSHHCYAALVQDLASPKRELATNNLNLKVSGRSYFVELNQLATGKLLAATRTGKDGFSGDRFDRVISEALSMAERLPQVLKQDYEPRLLGIPAIHFVAVWLHGESDDIIIPLPPTFDRWKAYGSYSEKQMIKLLKPEAKKVLAARKLTSSQYLEPSL